MKFQSKSQEELDAEKIMPDGVYPFEISGATEETSKSSGLPMIVLTVRVFKPDGTFNLITDYLSSSEKAMFKLNNICKAVGLLDEYTQGHLEADMFIGKTGELELTVRKSEAYGDSNNVKKYIVSKDGGESVKPPKDALDKAIDGDDIEDDIIPF